MRSEELPTDAGTDPAVCTTESALVVLEALLDVEDDEELKVEELKLNELELVEDEDGVGLGLEVVEGGGGGVQVVVGGGGGGGCEVVVGSGGGCEMDIGTGTGAGALPKDHEP